MTPTSQPTRKVKVLPVHSISRQLNKFFSYLFIFFLPLQITKHFWPAFAFVRGVRLDYLSPTLYLTDLIALLLLLTTPRNQLCLTLQKLSPPLLFFAFSLLFSPFPLPTLVYITKLTLYLLTVFSLTLPSQTPRYLLFSLFLQTLLALRQFLFASSGTTLTRFIGELYLKPFQPSVASTIFLGRPTLRAYGTFPHPNVLAGWSVISLAIIFLTSPSLSPLALLPTILILFLTQSRLALFAFLLLLLQSRRFPKLFIFFSLLVIFYLPRIPRTLALSIRLPLTKTSLTLFSLFPFFGTGLGSSLPAYPSLSPPPPLLQPDHFLPTLFLSWTGLSGLLLSLYFLTQLKSPPRLKSWLSNFFYLFPLLFDHYLFTIKQTLLIFLLFTKLILARITANEN